MQHFRISVCRAAGWLGAAATLALVLLAPAPASAQSGVCRQLESELAALDRPVSRPGRAANAERAQLARVNASIASLNCNRGFVLFGPPVPPQCSGLKAQAGALQGRIASIEAPQQVASGGSPARRRQLMAALDSYNCRGRSVAAAPAPQPQPQSRTIFDVLFGRPTPQTQPQYATAPLPGGALPPLVDGQPVEEKLVDPNAKKFSGGGSLPVCVRTCDGYFFPVNYEGTRAEGLHAEMCQASCPAAATELYWMPAGADLDRAANEDGLNYTQLPNAFKYRQSYDPACTCKQKGQPWGAALQQAEALIGSGRNDITVTSESSAQMARPSVAQELRGARGAKKSEAVARAPAATAQDAPLTTSTVVSPIDPPAHDGEAPAAEDGEKREAAGANAARRAIRRVAPH